MPNTPLDDERTAVDSGKHALSVIEGAVRSGRQKGDGFGERGRRAGKIRKGFTGKLVLIYMVIQKLMLEPMHFDLYLMQYAMGFHLFYFECFLI